MCWRVAAHICMPARATLWILLKYDTIIPAVITIDLAADGDASPVGPRQDTVRRSAEATEVIQRSFMARCHRSPPPELELARC